jgi:hypothetical protein
MCAWFGYIDINIDSGAAWLDRSSCNPSKVVQFVLQCVCVWMRAGSGYARPRSVTPRLESVFDPCTVRKEASTVRSLPSHCEDGGQLWKLTQGQQLLRCSDGFVSDRQWNAVADAIPNICSHWPAVWVPTEVHG